MNKLSNLITYLLHHLDEAAALLFILIGAGLIIGGCYIGVGLIFVGLVVLFIARSNNGLEGGEKDREICN